MKILFMASGSVRSNFTQRIVFLGSELRKLGHEVTIVAPKADKYNDFTPDKIKKLNGVVVKQPFQFATQNIILNLLPYIVSALILVLREKPDLVYIYKPTPVSVVGLISKLLRRTPTILDMDDMGSEVMRQEGHPAYQRRLVAECEKLAARYADKIVVTSTYLRDMFHKQYPKKPIYMLPNGVEETMLAAKILRPEKLSHTIVFLGAINRRSILKPLFDTLPAVTSIYPDVKLLIIGDGQELPYFRQKVQSLKLGNYIEFAGWLPLDNAVKLFEAGDIGYNYMPNETTAKAASNMKVSQYMAYGLVPLVSDIGDSAAMIDDGQAGYIAKADNLPDLTQTIIQALGDENRSEKAVLAQQIVRQKYNWKILATDLEKWLV